jgi:hypothetical protein
MPRIAHVIAPLSVAALMGSGILTLSAPSAAEARPTATGVTAVSTTQSESDASATARAEDRAVVVDSETTPTQQVEALPDGTFRYEVDSLPVRVDQNGTWVNVDTTLTQLSNGLWAPAASPAQVRFGSGGSNVLDKVETPAGDWITETWPYGNLPAPILSGSTATYVGVLPGIDVRLTATASGMSDVLVIGSASAAANPDLQALNLPVSGATVASIPVDTMTAKAADGSSVMSASPLWWDSSNGSSTAGPQGNAPARPVKHSVSARGLTLDVTGTVSGANPTYPVYVDPDWSTGANAYWFTDAAYPDQSYLDGNYADGIQAVGIGDGYQSDMFWQFPMGALAYKHILGAVVNTTQLWSGSCSLSPISVHLYGSNGPQPPGFTWNQEQSWSGQWWAAEDDQNPTAGCPGQAAGAVGWNVTSGIALYASYADANIEFGWTYDNGGYSRRHYSQSASLIVTYNTPPNNPANPVMTSPARGCESSSSPAVVNGNGPISLQADVTDPDAGQLVNTAFYVADGTTLTQVWRGAVPDQAQGDAVSTIPGGTLTNGTTYAWRAQAGDGIDLSPGFSPWCYFTIDDVAPVAPSLPAGPITGLTVGSPVSTTSTPGGPAGDAVAYEVWVASGTDSSPVPDVIGGQAIPACGTAANGALFVCPGTGGNVSLTVAPVTSMSKAWAAAIDGAGNMSPPAGVVLQAADASEAGSHGWHLQQYPAGALPSTIVDDNTAAGTGLTSEKDLIIGAGLPLDATGTVPVDATPSDVFAGWGLVSLDREVYDSSIHYSAVESFRASGYTLEGVFGQLLPMTSSGTSPWGSSHEIYSCDFSNGRQMISPSATCEGAAALPTALGFALDAQPAGEPSVQLWRCTNGLDHMITTSSTCEGWNEAPDESLGWFLKTGTISTASQGIDTTKSFSASAWVFPEQNASSTFYHTILSEDGTTNSGFYLQEAPGGYLRFCVRSQLSGAAMTCASNAAATTDGGWTMVTGIYDAVNRQLRLLVGYEVAPVATTSYTAAPGEVSANGGLVVGSAFTSGKSVDQWNGQIADPVVIPSVIDSGQLNDLYYESPVG